MPLQFFPFLIFAILYVFDSFRHIFRPCYFCMDKNTLPLLLSPLTDEWDLHVILFLLLSSQFSLSSVAVAQFSSLVTRRCNTRRRRCCLSSPRTHAPCWPPIVPGQPLPPQKQGRATSPLLYGFECVYLTMCATRGHGFELNSCSSRQQPQLPWRKLQDARGSWVVDG